MWIKEPNTAVVDLVKKEVHLNIQGDNYTIPLEGGIRREDVECDTWTGFSTEGEKTGWDMNLWWDAVTKPTMTVYVVEYVNGEAVTMMTKGTEVQMIILEIK